METFEDILLELGNPGCYRILQFLMHITIMLPCGLNYMVIIFTNIVPNHHCKISTEIEWNSFAKISSRNTTENIPVRSCELWFEQNNHSAGTTDCIYGIEYELEEGEWFVSTEFELVCSRTYIKTIGLTFQFVGIMLGGIVFGFICDKRGRRPAMIIATVLQSIFSLALGFSTSATFYFICSFLIGFFFQGMLASVCACSSELFHPNHRTYQGICLNLIWSVSLILVSTLFWILRRWNYVQIAIALISILPLIFVWLIPESLRWLLTNGKIDEAFEICKKFYRFNKIEPPADMRKELLAVSEKMIQSRKESERTSFKTLLQFSQLRKCTLILGVLNFLIQLMYFSMSFVIPKLGGNKYLCYLIIGSLEIITRTSSVVIFQRFGRRIPISITMVVACASCLLCSIFPYFITDNILLLEHVSIGLAISGILFILVTFNGLSLYMTEVYPTLLRGVGLSVLFTCGNIGGIIAPSVMLLDTIWKPLPILLCSLVGILSGLSILLMPETNKKSLPDSVAELKNLYKN